MPESSWRQVVVSCLLLFILSRLFFLIVGVLVNQDIHSTLPYSALFTLIDGGWYLDIAQHGYVMTPGRFVGAEETEEDGEQFDEKMKRLARALRQQQIESNTLDAAITTILERLGYGES